MADHVSAASDTSSRRSSGMGITHGNATPDILVVEDNPIMVAILGKILHRLEVPFVVAQNGAAAIEECKKDRVSFPLILMDIKMPHMNGMEATKAIRVMGGYYTQVPIIAVTADLDSDDIAAYRAAGMTDCIKKPVNHVDLESLIKTHMRPDAAPSPPPIICLEADIDAAAADSKNELDVLNWETLREYQAIMKKGFEPLLRDYLKAGPTMMDALADAVIDAQTDRIEYIAHKLKSTSIIFGAETVSNLAAQLQTCAKTGDMQHASDYYRELHICFERTNHALKKKLTLMKMGC